MEKKPELMRCRKAKCWRPSSCKYLNTARKGRREEGSRERGTGDGQEGETEEEEGGKERKGDKTPIWAVTAATLLRKCRQASNPQSCDSDPGLQC